MNHHAWTRPLATALLVYATAGLLNLADGAISWPQVAWVTCALTAGTVAGLAARQATPGALAYAATAVLAAGGWLIYTVVDSPWTSTATTAWAVLTGGLAPIYPGVQMYRARREARELAEMEEAEVRRQHGEWVALWRRIGFKGLAETGQEETRAGLKVYMDLPDDGKVELTAMQRACRKIEVAAGLRRGSIRVVEGELAHQVVMHINTVDVLAEVVPIPEAVAARPGGDPFDVGQHEDGSLCLLNVDKHGMIVGITDAGKSNLINAIIKKLGEGVDTLIWVIDPKGGRLVAPWLQAWLEERCERPVLDWVATRPAEWNLLLDAALAIQKARSEANLGGEKVTASAALPRIVIIIDEVADVTADLRTMRKIKELVRKGRSEEIKLLLAGQRGTVTMFGDGDLKSQLGTKIGLGVATVADAQRIFPDNYEVASSLARMQYPGCMYVQAGPRSLPLPAKAYRIEYEQIPTFAVQLAGLRPGLDQLSARAAGRAYADRWSWERCGHLVGARAGSGGGPTPPPDDDAVFADLATRFGPPIPPILAAVEDVFERAGNPARLHTKTILAELPPRAGELTARRLAQLLAPLDVTPVDAWGDGEERGRGYLRQDVADARERIEAGTLEVPELVFGWPTKP
ncbi:hypothetical protein ACBJ59_12075 [Nonomuraea sp. MTCD27]|uniref:hypothetical protein n=1 Tax=Nonomuraea sp. MTCD27 TaxID=1676747 RepID=UPI0035C241F9